MTYSTVGTIMVAGPAAGNANLAALSKADSMDDLSLIVVLGRSGLTSLIGFAVVGDQNDDIGVIALIGARPVPVMHQPTSRLLRVFVAIRYGRFPQLLNRSMSPFGRCPCPIS